MFRVDQRALREGHSKQSSKGRLQKVLLLGKMKANIRWSHPLEIEWTKGSEAREEN